MPRKILRRGYFIARFPIDSQGRPRDDLDSEYFDAKRGIWTDDALKAEVYDSVDGARATCEEWLVAESIQTLNDIATQPGAAKYDSAIRYIEIYEK